MLKIDSIPNNVNLKYPTEFIDTLKKNLPSSPESVTKFEEYGLNLNTVASSHSGLIAEIAVISFTVLLLVYPLFFNPHKSNIKSNSSHIYSSLIYFFFSFIFGFLSSFQYSNLSGSIDQIVTIKMFAIPSTSFAMSIICLLSGFIYTSFSFKPDNRNSTEYKVFLSTIIYSSKVIIWSITLLLIRTYLKGFIIQENLSISINLLNMILGLFLLSIIVPKAFVPIQKFIFKSKYLENKNYPWLMLLIVLYCIFMYAYFFFAFKNEGNNTLFIFQSVGIVAFILFYIWTIRLIDNGFFSKIE